jgi:PEP-CTERM motif
MTTRRSVCALVVLLVTLGVAAPSAAIPITINFSDSGWYDSTGLHDPTNVNYIAGDLGGNEFRDWFIFDLTSLVGQTILSASLALANPSGGYTSLDATENYALFDVSTSPATLALGGSGLVGIFNDLGTGTSFGSRTVSAADNNTTVLTAFNAAGLSALNAAIGGSFALGGAVTTLTLGGPTEFIFGFTGPASLRELRLEVEPAGVSAIPEPASLALLGTGIAGLAARRLRRRRN